MSTPGSAERNRPCRQRDYVSAQNKESSKTRSGSYNYLRWPPGQLHDWEFRTALRVRMYQEGLKAEAAREVTASTSKETAEKEGIESSLVVCAEGAVEKGSRSELVRRVVEGLRGEVFLVARDLGLDALAEPNGLS